MVKALSSCKRDDAEGRRIKRKIQPKSVNFATHDAESEAFPSAFPTAFPSAPFGGGLLCSSSPVDKWKVEKIHPYVKICIINTA